MLRVNIRHHPLDAFYVGHAHLIDINRIAEWMILLEAHYNSWRKAGLTHFTKKNKGKQTNGRTGSLDLCRTQCCWVHTGTRRQISKPQSHLSPLLAAFKVEFWELFPLLLYVGCFLLLNGDEKHGVESKILFDVNAVSTGKSIRRRNRKCRFSCPRVYFVTLTTSRKFSEPQFPYLQVRDVNSNLLQGWCENSGPSADCMHGQLCDIPFTLHEILRYRGRNWVCERTRTRSGG